MEWSFIVKFSIYNIYIYHVSKFSCIPCTNNCKGFKSHEDVIALLFVKAAPIKSTKKSIWIPEKRSTNAHEAWKGNRPNKTAKGYMLRFKHPWNLTRFLKKCYSNSHSTQVATASFDGSVPGISCCPEPPSQNLHLFRSHAAVDAWAGTPVAHTEQDLVCTCRVIASFCSWNLCQMKAETFPGPELHFWRLFSLLHQLPRIPTAQWHKNSESAASSFMKPN